MSWASAIGNVLGMFGGGGSGPAVGTGYQIEGQIQKTGFTGQVYALTANKNEQFKSLLPKTPNWIKKINDKFGALFAQLPADVSLPVNFKSPVDQDAAINAIGRAVQQFLSGNFATTGGNMTAPNVEQITGRPTTAAGSSTPAASAINGATAADVTQNPYLIAAALIAFLFLLKG